MNHHVLISWHMHRGVEKIVENEQLIIQYLPYVTRSNYLAVMSTKAIIENGAR